MAGTSPLLKRPQQEQQQIIHHHHHHHFNDEYVSPTYTSTPLFKPEISPYDAERHPPHRKHAWGTHIHQYAGIGPLTFLGSQPKTRDLYVARSHRHYLSGFSYVRHDQINKSHITPFKKSLNRANDDLVPPAALIPLEKYDRIREETQVIKEDKYASHQECCELFPQSSKNTRLEVKTREEIKNLLDKRYGQTTYSESYYNQKNGTTLSLGPQFQFYPSDDEEENEEKEEEAENEEAENAEVENAENKEDSENTENVENAENTENEDAENTEHAENTDNAENTENDKTETQENSTDPTFPTDLTTQLQTLEQLEIEAEKARNSPDRAFWPAWPGNLSNQIQPVTLKIAEKRDVCCKQDINDVRMTPVFTHHQPPDYQLFPKISDSSKHANKQTMLINRPNSSNLNSSKHNSSKPISSRDVAPAKVDFAYSGQETMYGSDAERALQSEKKVIRKMPGCSRWRDVPVDKNVDDNIDDILRRNAGKVLSREVSEEDLLRHNMARPKSSSLPKMRKSSSIEELEQTINGLQQPMLPPLWESLQYSGDRVVDRLGVRFKSIAQQRYHQQHPQRIPVALQEYLRDKVTCYKHPCRRRQYFYNKDIHMGSMFRWEEGVRKKKEQEEEARRRSKKK